MEDTKQSPGLIESGKIAAGGDAPGDVRTDGRSGARGEGVVHAARVAADADRAGVATDAPADVPYSARRRRVTAGV